nr:hypothetical protein [Methanoculleus sp.]
MQYCLVGIFSQKKQELMNSAFKSSPFTRFGEMQREMNSTAFMPMVSYSLTPKRSSMALFIQATV